MLLLPIHNKAR